MLAILELMGLGLSVLVLTGTEDDEITDEGVSDGENSVGMGHTPVTDVTSILDASGEVIDKSAEGRSVIFSGDGDDTVLTGREADYVDAEAGNDHVKSGGGDDEIIGGEGDDSLFGSIGDDILHGEAGQDQLISGSGNDQLFGGEGSDPIEDNFGDDTLGGGAGADHLFGGAGHDELYGGDDLERDFLNGGSGNDVLKAAANDHLNGGAGSDIFVIPINADVVVDDFDATQDQLEVLYEGDTAPTLYLENNNEDLSLIAGDETVATFPHGTPIDLSQIKLVAA